MRRLFVVFAPAAVVAIAVAGCGGSNSKSTASQSTATSSNAHAATIAARKTGLGTILVDSTGRTLYLFEKDKGDKSSCAGACASAWPPVITAKPMPGAGVSAAKLGTTRRSDGTMEATYNGHPLYTYAGDAAPGQTTGEGLDQFGAEWYALSPHGNKVEKSGS